VHAAGIELHHAIGVWQPPVTNTRVFSPLAMRSNAVSTQVMSPPFFIVMPFRDAITTGLTPGLILVAGACALAVTGVEAAIPAAALEMTKSRLLIFLFIFPPDR
jgi:hypothetical protein